MAGAAALVGLDSGLVSERAACERREVAVLVALAVLAGFRFFRGDVAPFFCLVCLAMQSLLGSVSPTKVGGVGRTGNSNRRVEKRQAQRALLVIPLIARRVLQQLVHPTSGHVILFGEGFDVLPTRARA